ncbi:T-complex protein 1 subunit TCPD [Acrasis kona]|uniref:T-complex protein 1 subunit TCPD n=1 Tax=Acrasis kona TaxID=1008807 RepID=A0AAW2YHP2_9EUKA
MKATLIADDVRLSNDVVKTRTKNIEECIKIGEVMSTILGPFSMDKMFVESDGEVSITNDGVTALSLMRSNLHPAAKLLIQLSEAMDDQVGDGTTSVVVTAAALLKAASDLLSSGIHVMDIIRGYMFCLDYIQPVISHLSIQMPEAQKSTILLQVSKTALTSKISTNLAPNLASISTRAFIAVDKNDQDDVNLMDRIHIIRDVSPGECELLEPLPSIMIPVQVQLKEPLVNPKMMIISFEFDPSSNKLDSSQKTSNQLTLEQVDRMLKKEDELYKKTAVHLKKLGVNAIWIQERISDARDPVPEGLKRLLSRIKVNVFGPLKPSHVKSLCNACENEFRPVTSYSQLFNLTRENLEKHVFNVPSVRQMNSNVLVCLPDECARASIVIRGPSPQALDELDRALHDVLRVLCGIRSSDGIIPGGCTVELVVSAHIKKMSSTMSGTRAIVMESFCDAMEAIPRILCKRGNLNVPATLNRIHKSYLADPDCRLGVYLGSGGCDICDLLEKGIAEPAGNKLTCLSMAIQTCVQILKIDGVHC